MEPSLITVLNATADPTITKAERLEVPRELVQQVAANLKALARTLPYDEYATIVYRIARLRWRCELAASSGE
ncbi:MAG TPA: hypothetical protein VJO33_03470 [Gemmatimonadaceae bacterium]|nr:hypothetical protein [Gemmatimonadaceae bacterium]